MKQWWYTHASELIMDGTKPLEEQVRMLANRMEKMDRQIWRKKWLPKPKYEPIRLRRIAKRLKELFS